MGVTLLVLTFRPLSRSFGLPTPSSTTSIKNSFRFARRSKNVKPSGEIRFQLHRFNKQGRGHVPPVYKKRETLVPFKVQYPFCENHPNPLSPLPHGRRPCTSVGQNRCWLRIQLNVRVVVVVNCSKNKQHEKRRSTKNPSEPHTHWSGTIAHANERFSPPRTKTSLLQVKIPKRCSTQNDLRTMSMLRARVFRVCFFINGGGVFMWLILAQ